MADPPTADAPPLERLCVFCGSSPGIDARHTDAARDFGARLARHRIALVYGGARRGLMGALADATLENGGRVTGVIPRGLWEREVGHTGLSELLVVDTMHERKALMAARAQGFVALPGGAGTLEELFEAWTWAQLGIHAKPVALLNVGGFYDPLLAMIDAMVAQGFVGTAQRRILLVEEDPERLLAALAAYTPPDGPRWMTASEG